MSYAISQQEKDRAYHADENVSFISRFFKWAAAQDAEHHIVWTAVSLTLMAAVFFPFTMAAILFNGASFPLIIAAIAALALVVSVNLAAMPTRYSIPALLIGIVINIGAVIVSFCI